MSWRALRSSQTRVAETKRSSAGELQPDVVVMDINMPAMSGIEATRQLLQVSPASAVLMLTVTLDQGAVLEAVLAGASGDLLKEASLTEIEGASVPPPTGTHWSLPTSLAACLTACANTVHLRRQQRGWI